MAEDEIGRAFREALTEVMFDQARAERERERPYSRPGSGLFLRAQDWEDYYAALHAPRKQGVWGDGRPVTDDDRRRTWAHYQAVLAAHRPRQAVYASMTAQGDYDGPSLAERLILGR